MRSLKKLEGLYLVVTPLLPLRKLLTVVEKALKGGVDILQLIPGKASSQVSQFAKNLLNKARRYDVPLLINGDIQLMQRIQADGVHFDSYGVTPETVERIVGRKCTVGYTLGNDLERLKWSENVKADYVSFCSIFPTSSASQCEIVPIETLRAARSRTTLPIFAAGGIEPKNAHLVLEAGADGIAVISAILEARDPEQAAKSFKEIICKFRT